MKLTKEDIQKYATEEEKKLLEGILDDPVEDFRDDDDGSNSNQLETMREDPRLQDEYDDDLQEFLKYAEAMGLVDIYDVDELYEAYMGWVEIHKGDDTEPDFGENDDFDLSLYDDEESLDLPKRPEF